MARRDARDERHTNAGARRRAVVAVWVIVAVISALVVIVPARHAAADGSNVLTYGGGPAAGGWYGDEAGLTPALLTGGTFGQLWSASVDGQVYAQPLVDGNTVIATTEANKVYGLDKATGAVHWTMDLGAPWDPSGVSCFDLAPTVGVTGTPVIDQATNTVYMFSKTYASGTSGAAAWSAHALDATTGAERPGFPLRIQGAATNDPSRQFNATTELQRPALSIVNGEVLAAFGGHCDYPPYTGWIVGVDPAGSIRTLWADEPGQSGSPGGGIWMSGGGLVNPGGNEVFLSTGNGNIPNAPTAGNQATSLPGNAVVRAEVQADGSIAMKDFFIPYDAPELNLWDADFGSGSPVVLAGAPWATGSVNRLALSIGKEGYLYVLNADNLGGYGMGTGGGDQALARIGPIGGAWSSPAAWPGAGGYVYLTTADGGPTGGGQLLALSKGTTGDGAPTFTTAGAADDVFGFGSGSPIVTSDGTTPGSALVWSVWSSDGTGAGAELRAYNAVPVDGHLTRVWSAPIGQASKFSVPAVADAHLYVGTRDGHVLAFGSPVTAPLTGSSVAFGGCVVGSSSIRSLTVTATGALTVNAVTTSNPAFTVDVAGSLPRALNAGQQMSIPVTFTPTAAGAAGGTIAIATTAGTTSFSASGNGVAATGTATLSPSALSFGGSAVGGPSQQQTAILRNVGATAITVTGITEPAAPFSVSGLPAVGTEIAAGQAVSMTISFNPQNQGLFVDDLGIATSGGATDLPMSATASPAGHMTLSTNNLDFGTLTFPAGKTLPLTVSNTGGTAVTITRSKPPVGAGFSVDSPIPEGTSLAPGASIDVNVTYTASTLGPQTASWQLNATDGLGVRAITFTGDGIAPRGIGDVQPPSSAWTLNGVARSESSGFVLTDTNDSYSAGTAFWPAPVASNGLSVSFDATIGNQGADGLALVLGDPNAGARPSALGAIGGGLGADGIPGVTVRLDTAQGAGEPSNNFVGIGTSGLGFGTAALVATSTNVKEMVGRTTHVQVDLGSGSLTVAVDGTTVLTQAIALPDQILVGFSAGTGALTDKQEVTNASFVRIPQAGPIGGLGWTLNGTAIAPAGGGVQLTSAARVGAAGSTYVSSAVNPDGLSVAFDAQLGGGSGADGLALDLADAGSGATATSLGASGGGLGFASTPGLAIALDTFKNAGDPSSNFVGVASGSAGASMLQYGATSTRVPNLRTAVRHVVVSFLAGTVSVSVDGVDALDAPIVLPARAYVGFSAGNGSLTDDHVVSNVTFARANPSAANAPLVGPIGTGWSTNGSAGLSAGSIQLTQTGAAGAAGSAFWPTPIALGAGLHVHATVQINGPASIGDGMTVMLGDAAAGATATSLGNAGGGLGATGVPGVAVAIDLFQNDGEPAAPFVGIASTGTESATPPYVATTGAIPSLGSGQHQLDIVATAHELTISVDGVQVLDRSVDLPGQVLLGVTGGTGAYTASQTVTALTVAAAPVVPALGTGWIANGSTVIANGTATLTPVDPTGSAGSAFWAAPVSTADGLQVAFDSTIGGGVGGDGLALVLANAGTTVPTAVGTPGGGLGFAGIDGDAVTLDTYGDTGEPPGGFVGVPGPVAAWALPAYIATANVDGLRTGTRHVVAVFRAGRVQVSVDGVPVIDTALVLPPSVLVGFTGGTGAFTDLQAVGNVVVGWPTTGVTSVTGPPAWPSSSWVLNGSTLNTGNALQLTDATPWAVGSAFWPTALSTTGLQVAFTARLEGGSGADGMTMLLADPSTGATPLSLGRAGGDLGAAGIPGVAVVLDTFQNSGEPSGNFVGIETTERDGSRTLIAATPLAASLRGRDVAVVVTVTTTGVSVSIDGVAAVTAPVAVAGSALLGFTAANGSLTDVHAVTALSVTGG
jgi:hypothetical protein